MIKLDQHIKKYIRNYHKCFVLDFVYRDKIGIILPYNKWLVYPKGLRNYLDLLMSKEFLQSGYFNNKLISNKIDEHIRGNKDNRKLLMVPIFFEIWRKLFIK